MKRMVTVVGRNRSHGTKKMVISYINERNKDVYKTHDWKVEKSTNSYKIIQQVRKLFKTKKKQRN